MNHPTRLYFCVKDMAKFSVRPFTPTEEAEASCAGVVHKTGAKLWEVESAQTWRDAQWLYEKPSAQSKPWAKTMRTFLRWRLRRYLKDETVELNVRKNPFEGVLWFFHVEPTFGLPDPKAVEYRGRLMRTVKELSIHNPSALKEIVAHHTKPPADAYILGLIINAVRGETTYKDDPNLAEQPPLVEEATVPGGHLTGLDGVKVERTSQIEEGKRMMEAEETQ